MMALLSWKGTFVIRLNMLILWMRKLRQSSLLVFSDPSGSEWSSWTCSRLSRILVSSVCTASSKSDFNKLWSLFLNSQCFGKLNVADKTKTSEKLNVNKWSQN